MLFSATHDKKTNELAKLALKSEPMEVDVTLDQLEATADGLEQGNFPFLLSDLIT